jgi:rhodanese-related sulfurtransferase
VLVVYCWGPGCNAATKAAAKLASLGFQVKEMIGGLEYWRREGYPVDGYAPDHAPLVG